MKPKPSRADILIIGGGLSGICAAIAASREGATVNLVERLDELGGSIGGNIQMPLDSAGTSNEIFFRESGLYEEIISAIRFYNGEGSYAGQARALLTFLKTEPNITPYLGYHCLTASLNPAQDRIESCSAISQREGNEVLFRAKYFVDASGCGHLTKLAEAPGEMGVDLMLDSISPHNATFRSAALIEVDSCISPIRFRCPEWVKIKWEKNHLPARASWLKSLEKQVCGFHHLEWITEDPEIPDAAELCWAAWDYLKNRSPLKKMAEGLMIKRIIPLPSPQNTFRGLGDYILTKKDLLSGKIFTDSVAVGRSPLCENRSLIYASTGKFALPQAFEIPLRCLYSKKVRNLLWTGGQASCDAVVSNSLSHPPTAAQMGSAVGFCSARCIAQKRLPRTLVKAGYVEKIRTGLNQRNHRTSRLPIIEEENLAAQATVIASTTWSQQNLDKLPKVYGLETKNCLIQFPLITDHLDTVRLLLLCDQPQILDVRLLSGSPQNENVPGNCLEVNSIKVENSGEQWIEFNAKTKIPTKGWYYLEIRSSKSFRLVEGRNAPPGHLVQYPRKLCKVEGENQYSNYSPIRNYHPVPHNCAVMKLHPIQKNYQANEVTTHSSRPHKGPDLWVSQPTDFTYPEFIEISWSTIVTLNRIELFFDPSFGYNSLPHPKPIENGAISCSIIKDYNIYTTDPCGKSVRLIEVRDNQEVHRSHLFEDRLIKSIELEIVSTHGLDRAQIFRIALYD